VVADLKVPGHYVNSQLHSCELFRSAVSGSWNPILYRPPWHSEPLTSVKMLTLGERGFENPRFSALTVVIGYFSHSHKAKQKPDHQNSASKRARRSNDAHDGKQSEYLCKHTNGQRNELAC
jgi:hypothetical protein